jgi:hypothetical protein
MRLNALLILTLLLVVIAAPIVDAVACDDCKDILPIRAMQECALAGTDHASADLLSCGAGCTAEQKNGTAKDLCPVCANTAVAMANACCGALFLVSQSQHLPKLFVLADPSYSISKPPQN